MITNEQLVDALKKVYDPEIPVNVYDLGLIYDVKAVEDEVFIIMSLTTATCPAAAFIPEEVKNAVYAIPRVRKVNVDVVYEPKWTKEKMSSSAKMQLGFN